MEGRQLQQIVRRGKHDSIRIRRALIIMASASGTTVPAIATLVQADEDTVRQVIHRFNEIGLACLDPQWAGGRPRRISPDETAYIVATALTRPEKPGRRSRDSPRSDSRRSPPQGGWRSTLDRRLAGEHDRHDYGAELGRRGFGLYAPAASTQDPAYWLRSHRSGPPARTAPRSTPSLDNLSANKTATILAWAKKNNVELCFTSASASWANPVEAQFGPLRTFTMGASNHRNHTVLSTALQHYLRWRNANARHPDVIAAQRRERARIRSERQRRWGRPAPRTNAAEAA